MKFTIDIEPTNRCNAKCGFCPRDRTPHQGLMTPEHFAQALSRAVEFRAAAEDLFDAAEVSVSLCGLGEPLLNRNTPDFVRQVRAAGFKCAMSSNASLLDEDAAHRLLDAGLQVIFINAGARDEEYEEVYALPFERTLENITRFRQLAEGRCDVFVILVNHHNDRRQVNAMKRYWQGLGIERFQRHDIMNRGGSLYVDSMQYEDDPRRAEARTLLSDAGVDPICGVAFVNLFIGWDGQYYLCCSDWEKRVPLGSVFDESFLSITQAKLANVSTREPICSTCCHDPVNRLTTTLDDLADGIEDTPSAESMIESLARGDRDIREVVGQLAGHPLAGTSRPARRSIPVTST